MDARGIDGPRVDKSGIGPRSVVAKMRLVGDVESAVIGEKLEIGRIRPKPIPEWLSRRREPDDWIHHRDKPGNRDDPINRQAPTVYEKRFGHGHVVTDDDICA